MKNKKNTPFIIPLVSEYSSRKEWEIECWERIKNAKTLLHFFITPHERHNIIMRVVVSQMINSGKSYREIGKILWVSPQTISSIVKSIKENEYRGYYMFSKEKQNKEHKVVSSIRSRLRKRRVRTKFGTIEVSF